MEESLLWKHTHNLHVSLCCKICIFRLLLALPLSCFPACLALLVCVGEFLYFCWFLLYFEGYSFLYPFSSLSHYYLILLHDVYLDSVPVWPIDLVSCPSEQYTTLNERPNQLWDCGLTTHTNTTSFLTHHFWMDSVIEINGFWGKVVHDFVLVSKRCSIIYKL